MDVGAVVFAGLASGLVRLAGIGSYFVFFRGFFLGLLLVVRKYELHSFFVPANWEFISLHRCLVLAYTDLRPPDSTIGSMTERVIVVDREVMSGTPCFRGTRVPFKNLIDYLEGGHSLDEFLRQFPTVTREMAVRALEEAKESLFARIA